ncbi:hypothetical protein QEH56_09000 [Pelagicoccus enzymogenes]|uniref:hypothetical protein n=1 Tax=Pelagicoccus enzymogenes TaxID=2773457 RepID=UPI00280E9D9C|nr:hypothetical protein [Pelagicoccus enzymogenes]MDQ8198282.1 hypothetical protein [Pelagicoccus enzymogenes]
MKTVTALLTIALAALGFFAFKLYQEQNALHARLAELEAQLPEKPAQQGSPAPSEAIAESHTRPRPQPAHFQAETIPATPVEERAEGRIIRDFSKIMDNPQANEMMQASQRATLEVMYKDLLDAFEFTPEERIHFMDLMMARQMFRVETSMKMMGGASGADEMKLLGQEMKEYDELVKSEVETFLNDDKDAGEFAFYEKTLAERMSLSGFKKSLQTAGRPIGSETERSLLQIMAEQKSAFDFSSDLAEEPNYDLGPDRFSPENIENLESDMQSLHALIAEEAESLLDNEQLAALIQSLEAMREMQLSQLRMAANMFSQKSQP